MELNDFLLWLIGPGAGLAAYFILGNIKAFVNWGDAEGKRWVGLLAPAVMAGIAFAIAVGLDYKEAPVTAQAWGEALFYVMSAAVITQAKHAKELRGRK